MLSYVLLFVQYALYALILSNVIISWVPRAVDYPLGRWLYETSERLLAPIRRVVPPMNMGGGGLDFSPVVAYFLVQIVFAVLFSLLGRVGTM